MKADFLRNSYFQLISLYVFLIVINYFTPQILRVLVFTSLLILIYKSKDDAFWIALIWLIQMAPAFLFHFSDPNFNLEFYRIPASDRNLSFIELAHVTLLLKAIMRRTKYVINPAFLLIIAFSIFLFIYSFALGIGAQKILRTIRFLMPFSLLWSIPVLLKTKENYYQVFFYFLRFSLIVVILQLFLFITGKHFFSILGGQFSGYNEYMNEKVFDVEQDLIRPLYSTQILLINIISSIYFLLINYNNKPRLFAVYFALSFFGLIISGTRGYTIGSVVMIIMFMFLSPKRLLLNIKYILVAIAFIIVIVSTPVFKNQMSMAFDRIMTTESFIEGDITAGGTVQRFTKYLPDVMERFKESPILGWGFSNVFYTETNAHVAIANTLLNGGIIGLLVFILFILYFYFKSYLKYINRKNPAYLIIIIGLTGFLIIHSFSFAVFSFLIGQCNYACFLLFLSFSDIILRTPLVIRYLDPLKSRSNRLESF